MNHSDPIRLHWFHRSFIGEFTPAEAPSPEYMQAIRLSLMTGAGSVPDLPQYESELYFRVRERAADIRILDGTYDLNTVHVTWRDDGVQEQFDSALRRFADFREWAAKQPDSRWTEEEMGLFSLSPVKPAIGTPAPYAVGFYRKVIPQPHRAVIARYIHALTVGLCANYPA